MIKVEVNYQRVNSDAKFDQYDVSLQFYDGDTLVTETVISRWGIPIGTSPVDSEAENLRESLQKVLNHIESKYQEA